jgi:hypothetical protein
MSEYKLEVDVPHLPKGEPVQIPGLGTFANGETHEIEKEDAEAYRVYNGRDGELGQTLLQASKNMYGVEVSTGQSGGGNSSPSKDKDKKGDDD